MVNLAGGQKPSQKAENHEKTLKNTKKRARRARKRDFWGILAKKDMKIALNKRFQSIDAKRRRSLTRDVLLRNTMKNEWCYRDDDR